MSENTTEEKRKITVEMDEREAFNWQQMLNQNKAKEECGKEIDVILEKYNARLALDPNSTFNQPRIVILLNS